VIMICSTNSHLQYRQFDRRGRLSAIQALAIYTILVSSEQQRCLALSLVLLISMGVSGSLLVQESSHTHSFLVGTCSGLAGKPFIVGVRP
jgi:hypothetical protein